MDYSVAVIGGGLLGASFGWGLARRKIKTIVIDQGDNAIRSARGNLGLFGCKARVLVCQNMRGGPISLRVSG